MFVYNSCISDVRVLKEAGTLRDSGYDVQIVAVLDRKTEPLEIRDGIRIVRVDRQPPHYALLRRTRRLRKSVRQLRPRTARAARRRFRRLARFGQTQRRRLTPALHRFGIRAVTGFAARVYRYARWRVLLHVPPVRRWYYRRRTRRSRPLQRMDYEARMERFRSHSLRAVPPEPEDAGLLGDAVAVAEPAAAAAARAPAPPRRPRPAWSPLHLLARLDRRISHWCWRTVMVFHKPLMFLSYYRGAYRIARQDDFDVLHAHDLLTLPVGAVLSRRTRTPLLYDSHELYTEMSTLRRTEKLVWIVLEKLMINRAVRVITVCESIAVELSDRYGVATPVTVLNCPPRPGRPTASAASPLRRKIGLLDPADRIVLYQGGLLPNRGLEELIEAARDFDGATLVLMGWGRLEDELRELASADGLRGRVILTGPVSQDELLSYTAGADVGVIPYKAVGLNNYYTTPNKLFEYLAAGIPIACSRFPELKRFVEGHGAGLTFDPEKPHEIALAVNGILADPSILAEMRENSRRAGERFVWETESKKLLGVYDEVFERPARAAERGRAVVASA